ncbi:MAG: hypothetical protein AB1894_15220 [Chloroflexota bacterium]
MSSSNLYRMSGLALILGALIMSVSSWFRFTGQDLATGVHPFLATSWFITFVGGLFVLLGLPGTYVYQSHKAGKLGLIGFVMTFLGIAILEVGSAVLDGFVRPLLAANPEPAIQLLAQHGNLEAQMGAGFSIAFLVGFIGLNLGLIIYGIAMLRARVYPRWAAVMMIVGVPAIFLLGSIPLIGAKPEVLIFAGLAWCGFVLVRGTKPSVLPVIKPVSQTA